MSRSSERGKNGESFTARYLEERGWRILSRNYRVKGGEIDIIALKDDTLIFVEVKTRARGSDFDGLEAIDRGKQERVILAARRFLEDNDPGYRYVRFDAAVVTAQGRDADLITDIEYYEDAFEP